LVQILKQRHELEYADLIAWLQPDPRRTRKSYRPSSC
jgi:hypothetical protein